MDADVRRRRRSGRAAGDARHRAGHLLGPQFSPAGDATTNVLRTLSVFAVGLLFRPLGRALTGAYYDRHGRSPALRLSLLMMAGGSLLIALAPPCRTVGVLAPAPAAGTGRPRTWTWRLSERSRACVERARALPHGCREGGVSVRGA
ncbi:hypothetical protein [Streptomyces sp. NPDC050704]|uniref:hypothetical protein n=1 Tax=Streptomyces sp. NPDC050704 TaxID=3157219 RepID=UPI003439B6A9